jgi:hypothetical protein
MKLPLRHDKLQFTTTTQTLTGPAHFGWNIPDEMLAMTLVVNPDGTSAWYCKFCDLKDCQLAALIWPLYPFTEFTDHEEIHIDVGRSKIILYKDHIMVGEWHTQTNKVQNFFCPEAEWDSLSDLARDKIVLMMKHLINTYDFEVGTWGREQLVAHNLDIVNVPDAILKKRAESRAAKEQKRKAKPSRRPAWMQNVKDKGMWFDR